MINLYGRFQPLSVEEVNNQLKVLSSLRICSFECASECEGSTTSKPADRVEGYFLRGGEDIYGKDSLFIGCKVTPLNKDVIPEFCVSGWKIEGFIKAISSVFELNTGISVLLDVEGDSEPNTKFLLSGEAVHIRGFLTLGDKIEIINAKKFYWGSNTLRDGSPREYFSDSYLVTSIASVVHHARGFLNDNEDWISDTIAGIFPVGLDSQFSSKCLVTRDILGHKEIDVEVEIIAVHLTGWIRVSLQRGLQQQQQQRESQPQQHFYLYVAHTHTTWVLHVFRYAIGATVRVCNVLPVFLWNKMRGFAFTSRSSISVLTLPKALIEANSTRAKPSVAPTVPAEIRESCHMYTAFRADLVHRLSESILNLSTMKNATKRLVLCIELMAGEYQQLQSPSSILEYKDTFVYYNNLPAIDAQSPIRHLVSLRKDNHIKYSIQEEFSSPWHAAFYAVRGGCDIDHLCAQLPYVVSAKSISRNIEQKIRSMTAKCGLGSLRPFAAHFVDLFARSDGSHRLNLIVMGTLVKWESMHSGEGERFSALCVIRDAENAELHAIVTDCTQATVHELKKLATIYLNSNTSGADTFCIDGCQLMRGVESPPPVVLIHRPLCLFEENPSKLMALADVKLIVSAPNIKLFSPHSTSDDTLDDARVAKKMKVGASSESSSVAATSSSSAARKCSIRDILQRYVDRSRGSVAVTDTVTGLVIYKEANLVIGLKGQRCALTLRDEFFDDSLILYIPLVSAALVTVGMHIEMKEIRLNVSKGKKGSFYLEFVRGIRITKIAHVATLQRLCQRNQLSVFAATALTRCADHKMPPAIALERLYASYQGSTYNLATCPDRVLWTLTGHVLFVREIHVRLRCKSCYTNLANRYCVCPKGCGGSSPDAARFNPTLPNSALRKASRQPLSHDESLRICIVWEMTCVFDDGSGDCCVQFDGEDEARAYLKETHYPSAHIAVARIMDRIDEKVRENGAFYFQIFDSGEKKKFSVLSQTSSVLNAVDNVDDLDNQSNLSAAIRASVFSQVVDLVSRDEVNLALALHLKCVRRSSLWQFSGRRSGVAERDGGGCHVKVQTANGAFPHQVRFCKVPVPDGKRLLLTGCNLKILERENLRLEAWKMLKTLDA